MHRRIFFLGSTALAGLSGVGALTALSNHAQADSLVGLSLADWQQRLEAQIGFPLVNLQMTDSQGVQATFMAGTWQFDLYSQDAEQWFTAPQLA